MGSHRSPYDDVALAVPVTVPYVRYSIRGAHWFFARALAEMTRIAGIAKDRIDGLAVSSFTLAPDSAIGLTQHLGLSPRWLDHVPLGGASGVVALRRVSDLVFKHPVYIGDTIHVDGRIESRKQVDDALGLVETTWRIVTQRGRTVARARVELLWRRSPVGAELGNELVMPL